MSFKSLGVGENSISNLQNLNITTPTPVQTKAIPLILKNHHIMAQSKTGTGKTLAFLLPIIEKLQFKNNECIILEPTRELAKQIHSVVNEFKSNGVKSLTIYGGVSIDNQIRKLKQGVHIICGTPGRIIDLYKRRELKLNNIKFVVLDEGDRLWDMGFAPDIKFILNAIKKHAKDFQFMLFSATLPYNIRRLVKDFTDNKFEFLNLSRDDLTVGNTRQYYYMIDQFAEKYKTFRKILKREKPSLALVFVNTKKTASWLANRLDRERGLNYKIGLISGSLSQFQREKILQEFRDRKIQILIATDVAARGLDINNISHVINYDVPKFSENYVHRIGRTSRMNKRGVAITLCLKNEYEFLCQIEGLINKDIKQKWLDVESQQRYHNPFY